MLYGKEEAVQTDKLMITLKFYSDFAVISEPIIFHYLEIRFRLWDFFEPKEKIQVQFNVYNPIFGMPSTNFITLNINMPP